MNSFDIKFEAKLRQDLIRRVIVDVLNAADLPPALKREVAPLLIADAEATQELNVALLLERRAAQ